MLLFWRKGYEATAMSDLVEGLGLGRGSIYAAFGDKHQLFVRALARYLDRQNTLLRTAFADEGPALAQLRDVLDRLLAADAACGNAGCFSVNSIAELLPHDEDVARLARQSLAAAEEAFTRQLARAADEGDLSPSLTPEAGARLLLTLVQGLQIVRKVDPDPAHTAATLDSAFTLLAGQPASLTPTA
ncbi:TetR/AcrR family transcriptional regulator, transcriptional repressor for nem operon [Streptacidiphilus jiangxiensis]|uniref:TetR/AcrR family transcriptional regulator, transcriptional repressor for nem operon n=2 Tax=Streptacidiphilus jiangxiensis TaxID=235985 RepID=A0A1H7HFD7_STRJI|nr:TetR/AcrR family transcriptional regulator, transcriptional repressor for nem operon [Streptacidiphilus jiangxiensis]